jgi:hypothetical protein
MNNKTFEAVQKLASEIIEEFNNGSWQFEGKHTDNFLGDFLMNESYSTYIRASIRLLTYDALNAIASSESIDDFNESIEQLYAENVKQWFWDFKDAEKFVNIAIEAYNFACRTFTIEQILDVGQVYHKRHIYRATLDALETHVTNRFED